MNGKMIFAAFFLAAAFTCRIFAADAASQTPAPDAEVKQMNAEINRLVKEKKTEEANLLREKIYKDGKYSPQARTNAFIAWANEKYAANKKNKEELRKLGDEVEKFFQSDAADKKNLHLFTRFLERCDRDAGLGLARTRRLQLVVVKEPEMNPGPRIDTAKSVAAFLRETEKPAEAEAILRALIKEKMPEQTHYAAVALLATHLAYDFKRDQAFAELDKLEKEYPKARDFVVNTKASLYEIYWDHENACRILTENGKPAAGAKFLDSGKRNEIFKKLVADGKLDIGQRRIAYRGLLTDGRSENLPLLKQYRDVFLDTGDARLRNSLINELVQPAGRYATGFNFERALFFLDLVKEFPVAETYRNVFLRAYALNGLRKYKEAKEFLEKYKDNEKFKPAERMTLNIMAAYTDPDFPASMENIMKKFPIGADMTAKQLCDVLCTAAGYAVVAELDEQAKHLHAVYQKQLVPEPRKIFDVKFFDKPVRNLTDFSDISFWRRPEPQLLDRKFGGSRDLLYTDVSTGNRSMSKDGKERGFTKFTALCDEEALRLIFEVPCDDPEAAVSGRISLSSFEMYLAPGFNQPYSCLIPDANKRETPIWPTTYDTAHHHRIRENTEDILNDIAVAGDKSYYKMISLNWRSFYNKLPDAGDEWEFECMHWGGPAGSWNGLRDIHARDSWGRLRFRLTDAQLLKIKRKIISHALAFYQAEKKTLRVKDNVSQPGVLYHWKDPVLGDPAFYEAKVKPLQEKLDSYIPLVKTDMTDADVEKVYSEAVEGWYNIEFDIAELRRLWINDLMFRE